MMTARTNPPGPMRTALEMREVIQFPVNVTVSANATTPIVGSSATAVGAIPRRPMHLVYLQCSGHCAAAANTPELNIGVFKNLIATGPPTPNTTNRALIAKRVVAAGAGASFYSAEPIDLGMDGFNGVSDFWTIGAWCTGATGTCSMSTFHIRLEFIIDY